MLHNVIAGATSKDSDDVGIARTCAAEGRGRGVLGARFPRSSGFYVLEKSCRETPLKCQSLMRIAFIC